MPSQEPPELYRDNIELYKTRTGILFRVMLTLGNGNEPAYECEPSNDMFADPKHWKRLGEKGKKTGKTDRNRDLIAPPGLT
jgi:hypothetical protein